MINSVAIRSFKPLATPHANILILGSMPGKASLQAMQYYAYERNAFWRVMQELFGIDADLPYDRRCRCLLDNGIAVWDVLKSCIRNSSSDADIVEDSIVVNNFKLFYDRHPSIRNIYFNGLKAEQIYKKRVLPNLPIQYADIQKQVLPSTSPANATMPFSEKLQCWRVILNTL